MKKQAQYKEMILNIIKCGLKFGYETTLVRPINKVGSGHNAQYGTDHTREYTKYLDTLNISYVIGNDAPRGGRLGKYIEINLDKHNAFIKKLMEETTK